MLASRRQEFKTILVYYRARYYDPETGEFISRDPLGYVDGMSLYRGYFASNRLDPSGKQTLEVGFDVAFSMAIMKSERNLHIDDSGTRHLGPWLLNPPYRGDGDRIGRSRPPVTTNWQVSSQNFGNYGGSLRINWENKNGKRTITSDNGVFPRSSINDPYWGYKRAYGGTVSGGASRNAKGDCDECAEAIVTFKFGIGKNVEVAPAASGGYGGVGAGVEVSGAGASKTYVEHLKEFTLQVCTDRTKSVTPHKARTFWRDWDKTEIHENQLGGYWNHNRIKVGDEWEYATHQEVQLTKEFRHDITTY